MIWICLSFEHKCLGLLNDYYHKFYKPTFTWKLHVFSIGEDNKWGCVMKLFWLKQMNRYQSV